VQRECPSRAGIRIDIDIGIGRIRRCLAGKEKSMSRSAPTAHLVAGGICLCPETGNVARAGQARQEHVGQLARVA